MTIEQANTARETPLNADPEELAKFESLAERWWDPDGEFRPLHQINPLRVEFIRSRTELRGRRVIDVGCGGGILTESLAEEGARTVGIDLGERPLAVAVRHSAERGLAIDYRLLSAEAMARLVNETSAPRTPRFDVVTCLEMLEHVPDPQSTISACAQLMTPAGDLFFSTINRSLKAYALAIIGAEDILSLLPKGTHDYQKFIRPSELDNMARRAGLTCVDMTGMHYNPLTGSYRLGGRPEVNYLAHYRFA